VKWNWPFVYDFRQRVLTLPGAQAYNPKKAPAKCANLSEQMSGFPNAQKSECSRIRYRGAEFPPG
jgi:hypothetical protein